MKIEGSLTIQPIWYNEPPHVKVLYQNFVLKDAYLKEKTEIVFQEIVHDDLDSRNIRVIFDNKTDSDTDLANGLDKAVKIESLQFYGITDTRFLNQGTYVPYDSNHKKLLQRSNQDYLSWNGVWSLEFTLPLFKWIHRVLSMGMIYK